MNVRQVVQKDAIPSVDDPAFEADYPGDPDDEVVAVDLGGTARAYPLRYLHYHEIVNDAVPAGDGDAVPIAVTWCPLCGSAVVYDRRVAGGGEAGTRTVAFGVSGKLADDDLVMYDRETGSEWKQSRGECIAGELAGTGLAVLPAAVTTWARFREAHPDGEALAAPGGRSEAASAGADPEPVDYDTSPYEAYFAAEGFGLAAHRGEGSREWERDDIDPKAVVLGIERGDEALGFPLPAVEAAGGVVTATVGDREVVVFATDDGIHAFRNPGYEWREHVGNFRADAAGGGALYDGATGEPVDAPAAHTGESGSVAAEPLERVPARRLFAFAWQDDHGEDAFWSAE